MNRIVSGSILLGLGTLSAVMKEWINGTGTTLSIPTQILVLTTILGGLTLIGWSLKDETELI